MVSFQDAPDKAIEAETKEVCSISFSFTQQIIQHTIVIGGWGHFSDCPD